MEERGDSAKNVGKVIGKASNYVVRYLKGSDSVDSGVHHDPNNLNRLGALASECKKHFMNYYQQNVQQGIIQPSPYNSTPSCSSSDHFQSASYNQPYYNVQPISQSHGSVPGPGNAADLLPTSMTASAAPTLLPRDTIEQMGSRPHSVQVSLGQNAVWETYKGLSRVINLADVNDIEAFGNQLRNSDRSACLPDDLIYSTKQLPAFAITYVQANPPIGRFKFNQEQWFNLLAAADAIVKSGITHAHLWLDQCLWLRDASQGCWAHTGLVPYILYPVISLGHKPMNKQRSVSTYERMWPFVEEVAGLWSMGVIFTRELRDRGMSGSSRRWLSYCLRERLMPEHSLRLVLLNVYHGAADSLQTGWSEDVDEIKEMARWNFTSDVEDLVVGADWRLRLAHAAKLPITESIKNKLVLSQFSKYITDSKNTYLEQSRMVPSTQGWNGIREWHSGNVLQAENDDFQFHSFIRRVTKYSVLTNLGEFQVLGKLDFSSFLWLLVAMDGRSAEFSRGRVAWTKILHGELTCGLNSAIRSERQDVLGEVLKENLGKNVQVISISDNSSLPIQWV